MVGKDEVNIRITADSRGVAAGVQPALSALGSVESAARKTDEALDGIGSTDVRLSVHTEAIANARAEIARLRDQMAESLRIDPTVNTAAARLRIAELERSIRTLERTHVVPVKVDVDTSQLGQLQAILDRIAARAFPLSQVGRALRITSSALTGLRTVGVAGGGAAAGILGVVGAIGALGVVTAPVAADLETMQLHLENLTGSAHDAGVAMQELDAAARSMLISGKTLGELPHTMELLGDIAAGTGAQLSDVSLIFQQMFSKGRILNEELQQFAERQIPAIQILAQKLHVTEAEVRKMAEEGKLGRREIDLLMEGLGEKFAGDAARSLDTFNGKMAQLRKNVQLTAADIGKVFLPAGKDMLDFLNDSVQLVDVAALALGHYHDEFMDFAGTDFLTAISPTLQGLDLLDKGIQKVLDLMPEDGIAMKIGPVDPQNQAVEDLGDIEDAAKDLETQMRDLETAFQDAVDEFGNIGGAHRAKVDFIISQDDLAEDITKAINGVNEKGTKNDIPPVQLPVDITMGSLPDLTDQQQDLVGKISDFAQQGLEEGARRAKSAHKWGFEFDEKGFFRDLRGQLVTMVMTASPSMNEDQANAFVTNILGLPPTWKIKPRIERPDNINQQLDDLLPKEWKIDPRLPPKAREALENSLGVGVGQTDQGFTAPILPEVDDTSLTNATGKLDTLAADRTVKLFIKPIPSTERGSPLGPADPFLPINPSSGPRSPANVEGSAGVPRPTRSKRDDNVQVSVYMDSRLVGTVPGRVHRGRRNA